MLGAKKSLANKWIRLHGQCIFFIGMFLLLSLPLMIIKFINIKKNYTELHRTVDYLQMKVRRLEAKNGEKERLR